MLIRVEGFGFRVQGSGFRVWGLGSGVWGLRRPFCLGDTRDFQELVAADMKREDIRVYSGQRFRVS